MKKTAQLLMAGMLSMVAASCGNGSSSADAYKIAQPEDTIANLNNTASSRNMSDNPQSSDSDNNIVESLTLPNAASESFAGTYEFTDDTNTWVLVVEKEHGSDYRGTAYIYNKSENDGSKYHGTWYKYHDMKYARFTFVDDAPTISFPSQRKKLVLPYIDSEWVYCNSAAAEANNPGLRLLVTKIK